MLAAPDNRRIILIVASTTLVILIMRLFLVLSHQGFLGVDGGAYLAGTKELLGMQLPQMDFIRPIFGPGWLLAPFILLFGDDTGYKIWAALADTVPILPAVYLLSTRFLSPRLSLAALFFTAINPWIWDMLVSGPLPMLAFAFLLLGIWGLIGVATGHSTRWEKLAVIGLALIPYINQTATGIALIALPVFVIALCSYGKSLSPIKAMLPVVAITGLLALPSLYWFKDVYPGSPMTAFPGPLVYISKGPTIGWGVFFWALIIGLPIALRKGNLALRSLAVVLIVHSFLSLFFSFSETLMNIFWRSQHLAGLLLFPLAVCEIARTMDARQIRLTWKAPAAAIYLAGLTLMVIGFSAYVFIQQPKYSDHVTPDMEQALTFIPDHDPSSILTGNYALGLWVAGIKGIHTYWAFSAEPPPHWAATYPAIRCVFGWRTDCDPREAARTLGIQYVLVDERFPYVNTTEQNLWGAPLDTWRPTNAASWLTPVFSQGTVRLWRIADA